MTTTNKARKLLVIDDDDIFNFLVEEAYREADLDCELVFITRAEEALEYLKNHREDFPDMIFVDINMPVMNGFEFLEKMKEENLDKAEPEIYMLSSSIFDGDINKAKSYHNVKDFISKPLTQERIKQLHKAEV